MILVVDDYADTGRAICSLLRIAGYACEWVSSGPEALARLRGLPPEQPLLVVLDEMMPEMTGTEVLRAIRMDPRIAHTTVILYSAGFDVEKRDQALALGAAAWLLKGGPNLEQSIKSIGHWYEKVGGAKTVGRAKPSSST